MTLFNGYPLCVDVDDENYELTLNDASLTVGWKHVKGANLSQLVDVFRLEVPGCSYEVVVMKTRCQIGDKITAFICKEISESGPQGPFFSTIKDAFAGPYNEWDVKSSLNNAFNRVLRLAVQAY